MASEKAASLASGPTQDADKTNYDVMGTDRQPEVLNGTAVVTGFVLDHKAERALCRKLDIRLLPVLAFMFLLNGLDKGNLGNAKTAGMDVDLHFKSNEYNLALSIFYIPFVLTAPPLVSIVPVLFSADAKTVNPDRVTIKGMMGKKYGPSRVLPLMMLVFGAVTLLMGN